MNQAMNPLGLYDNKGASTVAKATIDISKVVNGWLGNSNNCDKDFEDLWNSSRMNRLITKYPGIGISDTYVRDGVYMLFTQYKDAENAALYRD